MSEVIDEPAVEPASEPAAVEPVEPAAPAAPDWSTDPRFREAVTGEAEAIVAARFDDFLGQLAQIAEQPAGPQVSGAPSFDPLSDSFGNDFAAYMEQRDQRLIQAIGQQFAPIAQAFQAQQEQATTAEGNQRLQDMIADDIARNGEFASRPEADRAAREMVLSIASAVFPDYAARYGATPRAAESAIAAASSQVRTLLGSARQDGAVQETNRLASLAGAVGEPASGGGTAGVTVTSDKPLSAQELAMKYGSRAQALSRGSGT